MLPRFISFSGAKKPSIAVVCSILCHSLRISTHSHLVHVCLAQSELRQKCHHVEPNLQHTWFVAGSPPGMIEKLHSSHGYMVNGDGLWQGVPHELFTSGVAEHNPSSPATIRWPCWPHGPLIFSRRGRCFRPLRLLRNFRYPPHGALHITFRRSNRFRPKRTAVFSYGAV